MNNTVNSVSTAYPAPILNTSISAPVQTGCFVFEECGGKLECNYMPVNLNEPAILRAVIEPSKLPAGTKTYLSATNDPKPRLRVSHQIGNQMKVSIDTIMSDIQDVNVLIDNKVVIVTFADGTSEKAVLNGNDTFSLEQGISICVTKKLLSDKSDGRGSNLYNKIIDRAMKKYNKIQKEKKKAEEQKKAAIAKYQKTVAKKAEKRAKREAAAREAQIEIQKEAYLRAMQEFNNASEEQK